MFNPFLSATMNTHSADFASINWNGEAYALTEPQGLVIRELLIATLDGCPEMRGNSLLLIAGDHAPQSMSALFRGSKAWKRLIIPGEVRGNYRLADTTLEIRSRYALKTYVF